MSRSNQLLRRVAQDLRSQTLVLWGFVDHVQHAQRADSDDLRFCEMARRNLHRMLQLTERLELAADIEVGQLSLKRAPTDLWKLLHEAIDAVGTIEGARGQLSFSPPAEPLSASVDAALLRLALTDALSATLRRGVGRMRLSGQRRDGTVELRIEDDSPASREPERSWWLWLLDELVRAHGGNTAHGDGPQTLVLSLPALSGEAG